MPLFPAEFFADTIGMDPDAAKAYLYLLMHAWLQDAKLSSDDVVLARLAAVSPKRWHAMKAEVMAHWTLGDDGFYRQKRQLKEWEYTIEKVEKNKRNGSAGGKKKAETSHFTGNEIESKKTNENNKSGLANATVSLEHTTPTPTPAPTQYESDKGDSPLPPNGMLLDLPAKQDRSEPHQAFDLYNRVAKRVGLPIAQAFNADRRRGITARLKECGGLRGWEFALEKLASNPALRGDNDTGWMMSLDDLCSPKKFTKLVEGGYDNWKPKTSRKSAGDSPDALDRAFQANARRFGVDLES